MPFAFMRRPLIIIVTYTIVGSLFMPFLAATLLYLNNRVRWSDAGAAQPLDDERAARRDPRDVRRGRRAGECSTRSEREAATLRSRPRTVERRARRAPRRSSRFPAVVDGLQPSHRGRSEDRPLRGSSHGRAPLRNRRSAGLHDRRARADLKVCTTSEAASSVCSPHDPESLGPGNRVRRLRGGGDGPAEPANRFRARAALFTEAQAASGEALYRQSCASCHGATLTGGTAPALTGPAFEASWGDPRVTLDDLFFIARTTMPPRASGDADAAGSRRGVRLHPEGERISVRRDAADRDVGRAEARSVFSARRRRARPARPAPPAFIAGAAGAAPAASGPDQATLNGGGALDRLAVPHARLRRHPLLAARPDQRRRTSARLAPACIFQVGERDNFQTGPDRLQRHDVRDDDDEHDRARCRDLPGRSGGTAGRPATTRAFSAIAASRIKDGRVVRGTPDGYLLALNAETGAHAVGAAGGEAGRGRDVHAWRRSSSKTWC